MVSSVALNFSRCRFASAALSVNFDFHTADSVSSTFSSRALSAVNLDTFIVQAVGDGPHSTNFTSGGLELSPEVSELGGELLSCGFLYALAIPLAG